MSFCAGALGSWALACLEGPDHHQLEQGAVTETGL